MSPRGLGGTTPVAELTPAQVWDAWATGNARPAPYVAVESVNDNAGKTVEVPAADVDSAHTPSNYSAASANLDAHLAGIDAALGGGSGFAATRQLGSDFPVNSSTVLTNVTDGAGTLQVSCAGTRGQGRFEGLRKGDTAANSKFALVVSSGTITYAITQTGSLTNVGVGSGTGINAGMVSSPANEYPFTVTWQVRGATNPFTVTVQWAQQSSDPDDTTLIEGSTLYAEVVS